MNIKKTLKLTVPYYIMTAAGIFGPSASAQNIDGTVRDTNTKKNITVDKDTTSQMHIYTVPEAPVRPDSVREQGRDVIYMYNNGDEITRKRGSRAWRNNNPGNLRYSPFSRKEGAIGECGKYAVFPDEETGMKALRHLLATESYQKLTMAAAIRKYSPEGEEGIARYINKLVKLTGLPQTTPLRNLNSAQLNIVADAIRSIEGWIVGHEEKAAKTNNVMLSHAKANTVRNAAMRRANERTL